MMKTPKTILRFLFLPGLLAVALSAAAAGTVFHVSPGANGDGSSWASPANLRDALANAIDGDEVWVKEGAYYPDEGTGATDNDVTSTFEIPAGVAVYGRFAGTETSLAERESYLWLRSTVLSGDLGQDDFSTADIVEKTSDIVGANAYTVVTIRADGTHTHPTRLDGFVITAGKATGVNTGLDSPTESDASGGGIYVNAKNPADHPTPIIEACRLYGNFALSTGGGLYLTDAGELEIVSCDFRGNEARGGGAARFRGSTVLVNNSHFSGNFSTSIGGAVREDDTTSTYGNCTMTGNRSSNSGGGIASIGFNLTLINTLIWNNEASGGTTSDLASIANASLSVSYDHCLIQNIDLTGTGTGNFDGTDTANDPRFHTALDPANAPSASGIFTMEAGSPAIDAGNDSAIIGGITVDVLGHARRYLDQTVDIGAAETQPFQDCDLNGIDDRLELVRVTGSYVGGGVDPKAGLGSNGDESGPPPDSRAGELVLRVPPVSAVILTFFNDAPIIRHEWNVDQPDENVLVYVNGTYVGRLFDEIATSPDDPIATTLSIPLARWNALADAEGRYFISLARSPQSSAGPYLFLYTSTTLDAIYSYDLDVDDNGWLDDCYPNGDPGGPDSDGDGILDSADLSPNTIPDSSIVDFEGKVMRVPRFDQDEDGDVDVADYDAMNVGTRDVDGDGDADLYDLSEILRSSRGAGVAADPALLQELQLYALKHINFNHRPLNADGTLGNVAGSGSWDDGNNRCKIYYGTHLAVVDKELGTTDLTQEQQIAQFTQLALDDGGDGYWIGLKWNTDFTVELFQWENGQLFTPDELNPSGFNPPEIESASNWNNVGAAPGEVPGAESFDEPTEINYCVMLWGFSDTPYEWLNVNGDGPAFGAGAKMAGYIAQLPTNTVASAPETTTETVTVALDSSLNGLTILPGQTVDWTISFAVSSGDNSGLSLLVTDLEQNAGNPATFDLPAGDAVTADMQNFSAPLGFSSPNGFGGLPVGTPGAMNLTEIGGAQNNFGEASIDPSQGQGTSVVTGVGQSGSTVFATGSFTAPTTEGIYTFNLAHTIASVLKTVGGAGQGSEIVPANVVVAQGAFTVTVASAPVITLTGQPVVMHEAATPYDDPGATAYDLQDGVLNGSIVVNSSVNENVPGSYLVTYDVTDSDGNAAPQVTRTVIVVDTTPPVITLNGSSIVTHEAGTPYLDAGATAADSVDLDLTGSIITVNTVVANTVGSYTVTYNVSDAAGNAATTVIRTVNVVDTTAPVITLNGEATVTHEAGTPYTDAGATASDMLDGDLSTSIVTVNPVDANTPGTYAVTYNVSDAAGHAASQVTRTVIVEDTTAPVITLVGESTVTVEAGTSYTDEGATASDTLDVDLTTSIVIVNPVDANTPGTYSVTYNVSDAAGNAASQVTRTVIVEDTIAPVITLLGDAVVTIDLGSAYVDAGATASDSFEDDLTGAIVVSNPVDPFVPDTYTVTYNVSDAAGNEATQVTRSVEVIDATRYTVLLEQKLEDPNGQSSELFGVAVSIDGDTAVIGARGDNNNNGNEAGAVFVFVRAATTWTLEQKIVADDGDAGDIFGAAVFLAGDTLLVGAPFDDVDGKRDAGSVYVYTRSGATWSLEQKLTASDAQANGFFGNAVSFSNESALIGTRIDLEALPLGAYIFTRSSGAWSEQQRLDPPATSNNHDAFGFAVSLSGDTAAVSVRSDTIGSVQIYTRSGATWSLQQTLVNGDGEADDFFGRSLALDGDRLLVGASTADSPTATFVGAAYLFQRSGSTWTRQHKFEPADGGSFNNFGLSVGLQGRTALIGAAGQGYGAVYIFTQSGGAWKFDDKLVPSTGNGIDKFGYAAALSGDTVLVGAYFADTGDAKYAGNASVYRLISNAPTIILNGEAEITLEAGSDSYVEPGATATDLIDGDVPVVIGGDTVNDLTPGVYVVTYDATDSDGLEADQVTRTVTVIDPIPPVITIIGDNPTTHEAGTPYIDAGATAVDNRDGELNSSIVTASTVDAATPGTYQVTYDVTDSDGNAAEQAVRTVNVVDTTAPVIALLGANPITHEAGTPYVDAGATASDAVDDGLTALIVAVNPVDIYSPGVYTVTYDVVDTAGNNAVQVTRTVNVVDTTAPVIMLSGNPAVTHEAGDPYLDAGATAFDSVDGDLTGSISAVNPVDDTLPGTYTVTYNVTDAAGNPAVQVTRTVTVIDTTAPGFLTFPSDAVLYCGSEVSPTVTGEPTTSDNASGPVSLTHEDHDQGTCPALVQRTWTATDASGNQTSAIQWIYQVPENLLTDAAHCVFDVAPETTERELRLLFPLDPSSPTTFKLGAANPGQFTYHVIYLGIPGEEVEIAVRIPYPFVTRGSEPLAVHDGVQVTFDELGAACLVPGPVASTAASDLTLEDYGESSHFQLVVALTVPSTGVADLAVELDHGFKHTAGYDRNYTGDALDSASAEIIIPNPAQYLFEATTPDGDFSDPVWSVNEFKTNPGIAGLVQWMDDEMPVVGLTVRLMDASGLVVNEAVTDADGFYQIVYKNKGKPAIYSVAVDQDLAPPQEVELKGNTLAEVNFEVPAQ